MPPEFVQIAEVDGRPAAMIVIVPNVGECIRDLDGRLLPFGWARLLWRLKRRGPRSARVALMGVRKEYHRSTLATALAFGLINAVRQPILDHRIERLELSWTLEDNHPMRRIKERIGARKYKTYRLYEKAIAVAEPARMSGLTWLGPPGAHRARLYRPGAGAAAGPAATRSRARPASRTRRSRRWPASPC